MSVPVASYSASNSEYNLPVRKWKTELSYWTFEDFCNHYDCIQPSPTSVPMTAHLSVPESVEIVEEILKIQTEGNAKQFVTEVYNVMEELLPKRKCIYIISPPR